MSKEKQNGGDDVIARNRKAFHDYEIVESWEAGIALTGTEVKSCREKTVSLSDSYARILDGGQAVLLNANIAHYKHGNRFNHEPTRERPLLMRKSETRKIALEMKQKNYTLVPLKFYFKKGRVKVELALARGKSHGDKRETLRKKQDDMEAKRAASLRRK
jgi:SsrA-binding protein